MPAIAHAKNERVSWRLITGGCPVFQYRSAKKTVCNMKAANKTHVDTFAASTLLTYREHMYPRELMRYTTRAAFKKRSSISLIDLYFYTGNLINDLFHLFPVFVFNVLKDV